MIKKQPLISIIIPAYKNYKYIYENLNSILTQDYPNIEIIVTDDASDDFDKKAIEKYLKAKSGKNIKRFLINQNTKNLGTVKNLNKAIKLSNGKYITFLAADDIVYDNHVFSKYIECFNSLSKNELIVVSQIGMYDMKLKNLIQNFISNEDKEKIKNFTPQELFIEMSQRCILPGPGILYKSKVFKKYGFFNKKYVLVEDYASALKLSRLGVKFNYFDFISVKHRDGGISHGNKIGEVHKSKQYELDLLNILRYEVMPYIHFFDKKTKKEFIKRYQDYKWRYLYNFVYKNKNKANRRKVIKNNFNIIFFGFIKDFLRDFKDQFIGKKFKLFLIGLVIYLTNLLTKSEFLKILSFLFMSISAFFIVFFILQKYVLRLFNFLKYIF